jgi:hypothetical protein
MLELRFHPRVVSDLDEAIAWYEERSEGLGESFQAAVNARFDEILVSPKLFPRAYSDLDFRFARLARFPYLVLFRVSEESLLVLGVFHAASDPAKWRARAGKS